MELNDLVESIKVLLHPPPILVSGVNGKLQIQKTCNIRGDSPPFVASLVQQTLVDYGIQTTSTMPSSNSWNLHASVKPLLFSKAESYNLYIEDNLVTIIASDASGVFYGLQTLRQVFEISSTKGNKEGTDGVFYVPCLTIHDAPSFRYRGVMLDISRDKVYKLETVKIIVDLLAKFKYNQLQLYMEHTFAYKRHEEVWKHASPFTRKEILELHAYCAERFIDLVPNQNSFGHMHRWLSFDKYTNIAEFPEGIPHGFNNKIEPYSLAPTVPETLYFLKDLYSQLLPNFPGVTQFNVGLDETFELGKGKAKQECESKGVEVVYLEFLQKIHALLKSEFPNVTMQFWGDIILHRPDLLSKLPKDVTALDWGYEADHPFATSTQHFAASGIPFYVCPGTSSWNSIGGRIDNCYENLRNAAENGHMNGAIGYLITDWGDHGHWQQLPISYFGIVAGAGFSWNVNICKSWKTLEIGIKKVEDVLLHHVFKGREDIVTFLLKLGRAYTHLKAPIGNNTALSCLINFYKDCPPLDGARRPTGENLKLTETFLTTAKRDFEASRKQTKEEDPIGEELIFTCDLMLYACQFGTVYSGNVWELGNSKVPVSKLPEDKKLLLKEALLPLVKRYETLWLVRNRPGGLKESVGRMQALLQRLELVN